MKKQKDLTFIIPHSLMQFSEISKTDEVNIEVNDDAIIITKSDKTALELLETVTILYETASELVVKLAIACGTCDDCFECIESRKIDDEDFIDVPESVLQTFIDTGICLSNLQKFLDSDIIIR